MSGERDLPGEEELRASQPNATGSDRAAGGMGVSSERTGPAGPGQAVFSVSSFMDALA